jgi:hypothetical protein
MVMPMSKMAMQIVRAHLLSCSKRIASIEIDWQEVDLSQRTLYVLLFNLALWCGG